MAIYVRTLAPTVAGGDSGELITVAYTLGVAHPPGYPLYTMLAKLFTLIPIGTIAWRVNLFSAACGAGAATILFLAAARWSGSLWAALAAASLFAFSPRVWPHAVTAEVFALNNLFIAGLVYLTVRFRRAATEAGHSNERMRLMGLVACLLFFWIGLGLTNHHTLIFYAIPAALLILTSSPAMRTPRQIATFALCSLVGLLPYAYIPIASRRVPLMSWGDQTTLSGFLDHLLRREYGTFRLGVQEQATESYRAHCGVHIRIVRGSVLDRPAPCNCRSRSDPSSSRQTSALVLDRWLLLLSGHLQRPRQRKPRTRSLPLRRRTILAAAASVAVRLCETLGLAAIAERLGTRGTRALPVVAVLIAIAQPVMNFRDQDKSRAIQIHEFLKDDPRFSAATGAAARDR